MMEIEASKMRDMERLFKEIRKNHGISKEQINEMAELSTYFLYLAKATEFTN